MRMKKPYIAQELSLDDFGRLLTAHAGWGMRIVFVPEDEIFEEPEIVLREPDDENRRSG